MSQPASKLARFRRVRMGNHWTHRAVRALLVCVLTLVSARAALSQITAATISGTVNDETGGVLPGVSIDVKNLDTGQKRSLVTDGRGLFTDPGLSPGKYEVRASLAGFASAVQSGI